MAPLAGGRRRRSVITAAIAVVVIAALTAVVLILFRPAGTHQAGSAAPPPPSRAAQWIGAHVGSGKDQVRQWEAANAAIGPLQSDKLFFKGALPPTYAGSVASQLPAGVVEIINYVQPTTNVVSFVQSIPADRTVLLSYRDEVEDSAESPAQFLSEFEVQSALIRSAHRSNVQVVMDSASYQYAAGTSHDRGVNGAYLPPASEVDAYCIDVYQHHPTGKGLRTDPQFQGWLKLVRGRGKPLCIAEYGIDSNDQATGPDSNAVQLKTLKADNAYLKSLGGFEVWDYWWSLVGPGGKPQALSVAIADYDHMKFGDPAVIAEWQSIEQGG